MLKLIASFLITPIASLAAADQLLTKAFKTLPSMPSRKDPFEALTRAEKAKIKLEAQL